MKTAKMYALERRVRKTFNENTPLLGKLGLLKDEVRKSVFERIDEEQRRAIIMGAEVNLHVLGIRSLLRRKLEERGVSGEELDFLTEMLGEEVERAVVKVMEVLGFKYEQGWFLPEVEE